MKFNFAGKVRVGYWTAFILLLLSYMLTFYTNWQLSEQNRWVNHTNMMINNLEVMLSEVKDAETGVRGYMLMKDDHFLDPFYSSHAHTDSVYRLLVKLSSQNAVDIESLQLERLTKLRQLLNNEYGILNEWLTDFKEAGMIDNDSLRIHGNRGKAVMDSLRFTIGLMQQRENDNMEHRTNNVRSSAAAIKIINLSSLVIAILIAAYSVITFNSENKAKERAARKAEDYRKKLEERVEELKKLNQELTALRSTEKFATTGRLARTIAHEIRNPLTNIGLAADQLKGAIVVNDETQMLLDMINRNGTRINQLISELLSSTKFSELKYEPVSPNDLLDEAMELATDRIQLKKIRVEKRYTDGSGKIMADREKLKIALLNIIVNAVEAMTSDDGVLSLQTEMSGNKCIITITDNGTGMDSETLSKLFEPYFTSKFKGNGLGLTNTQNIILNHKGNIEVESELGKGTSFIISLSMPDSHSLLE
jgi:signal transduction histidine kinase